MNAMAPTAAGDVPTSHNEPPGGVPAKPGEKADAAIAKAIRMRRLIERTEERLQRLKADLTALQRREIPDILAEIGTTIWPAPDGGKVQIETRIAGSLSQSPDLEEAVKYLEAEGFKGAMETTLSVKFSDDERELAADLAKAINATTDHTVILNRAIHPQTLAAWARARLKAGKTVKHALVGLSLWREAKLPK